MRRPLFHSSPTCLAAAATLLVVPTALAASISVPGDHPTIQAAVNAAASGDVIEIDPGTWVGNVDIVGKQLSIVGTGTLPGDVLIQGSGNGSVIDITGGADVSLGNVEVTGGSALPGDVGGGIDIRDSDALLLGVAVRGNEANTGAGVYVADGALVMDFCLLEGNIAANAGGALYVQQATAEAFATLFWNNQHTSGTVFVNDGDALIERGHFTANVGTGATLRAGGSAGSDLAVVNSVLNDNQGSGPIVVASGSTVKVFNLTVVDNDSSSFGLASNDGDLVVGNVIARNPDVAAIVGTGATDTRYSNISGGLPGPGMIDADPMFQSGTFFQLDAGSPCVDAGNGNAISDDPDFLGQPRFVDDENVVDEGVGTKTYLDMGALERQPRIRYVDASATGSGNGLSWANAITDLQDAIDEASSGDVQEIWIAAGVYKPDRGTGDRTESFEMQSGLAILGGYAGTEERRADADPATNQVVLSGELGAAGPAGNTLHVVRATEVGPSGRLGGVIVQRGNADLGDSVSGGGIRIIAGAPQFNDVWVRQCEAEGSGSAIWSVDASPLLSRMRINRNGWSSEPLSAVHLVRGAPVLVSSLVYGNESESGSALYFDEPEGAVAANLTVWGNTTRASWNAGVFNNGGDLDVLNSIIWGNFALDPIDGQPLSQDNVFGISVSASHTTVEGWTAFGDANNGNTPEFVDPLGPDGVLGTGDDDLRLEAGSCLIDSGDASAVPPIFDRDVVGLDRFLDDPGTADTGVANAQGVVIDRGAHEFDGITCGGDVDGSGVVDFDDVLSVLASWGACSGCDADTNCDGLVDFDDLLQVLAAWGPCP